MYIYIYVSEWGRGVYMTVLCLHLFTLRGTKGVMTSLELLFIPTERSFILIEI